MKSEKGSKKQRRWMVAAVLIVFLSMGSYVLYRNINDLLQDALMRSFQSSLASSVYELKLERLNIKIFEGSLRISGVVIQPRDTMLKSYPYINGSFQLTAEELILKNVEILTLLRTNTLKLNEISIIRPTIKAEWDGSKPIFLPFKDSASAQNSNQADQKKAIESFSLKEFHLIDADFHIVNRAKERVFNISKFNISMRNLLIDQRPGEDFVSLDRGDVSLEQFNGFLNREAIRRINFGSFKIGIDSLSANVTLDTAVFHFHDYEAGLKAMDIQTADSLFHLTLQSLEVSHSGRSVQLEKLSFKPNMDEASLQRRYKYQHTNASGTVEKISLNQVDFDSLVYRKALMIGEVNITNPIVSILKDNTKPVDSTRVPKYFGQQIRSLQIPIEVKRIQAVNVSLTNVERKRDGSYAKVNITKGTAEVKNISNRSENPLTLSATAFIEDKVHFDLRLGFSYQKPEFSYDGVLRKFDLTYLNPVLMAYTPAKIDKGIADQINFSGKVEWTKSEGTMTFLYHDLKVNIALKDKAKWKGAALTFAANAYVHESNPTSASSPPRIVRFHAVRDMNKGFINLILKSVLSGIKETFIMSKENKKTFKEAKETMK